MSDDNGGCLLVILFILGLFFISAQVGSIIEAIKSIKVEVVDLPTKSEEKENDP